MPYSHHPPLEVSNPMHLIVYKSDYCGDPSKISSTLVNIRVTAKANNLQYNITGVLFYDNGTFIQVLEGEEASLRILMEKISNDSRHKNIIYLVDSPLAKRSFQNWNMDTIQLNLKLNKLDASLIEFRKLYTSNLKLETKSFVKILSRFLEVAQEQNMVNIDI